MKNKVFENIEALQQRIIADTFDDLRRQPEFITRAVRAVHNRTVLSVERNGGHVEGHGP